MINALPFALISVGALDTVLATCLDSDATQPVLTQAVQDGGMVVVVEVASNDNGGTGRQGGDRVHGLAQRIGYGQTEGATVTLSTVAAGRMDNEQVEGVASKDATADVEDITRGPHPLNGGDADAAVVEWREGEWTVEQGYVNAAQVGRGGHQVFIAGIAEQGTLRQIPENGIVLDLT